MADPKIATAAEQPINRHAAVAGEEMDEGDLVGIDSEGQMVQADAGLSGVRAVGICMTPAVDPTKYDEDIVRTIVESERALVGEHRVTAVRYGVEVENGAGDWAFVPGQPVYMDADGGYTQDDMAGEFTQSVGLALTENRISADVDVNLQ